MAGGADQVECALQQFSIVAGGDDHADRHITSRRPCQVNTASPRLGSGWPSPPRQPPVNQFQMVRFDAVVATVHGLQHRGQAAHLLVGHVQPHQQIPPEGVVAGPHIAVPQGGFGLEASGPNGKSPADVVGAHQEIGRPARLEAGPAQAVQVVFKIHALRHPPLVPLPYLGQIGQIVVPIHQLQPRVAPRGLRDLEHRIGPKPVAGPQQNHQVPGIVLRQPVELLGQPASLHFDYLDQAPRLVVQRRLGGGHIAAVVHHQSPHFERSDPLVEPLPLNGQHTGVGRQPAVPLPIGHTGRRTRRSWFRLGLGRLIRLGGRLRCPCAAGRAANPPDHRHHPADLSSAAGTPGQSSLNKTTNHYDTLPVLPVSISPERAPTTATAASAMAVYLMAGAEAGRIARRAANRFWTFYAFAAIDGVEPPSLNPDYCRFRSTHGRGINADRGPLLRPAESQSLTGARRRSRDNRHVHRKRLGPRRGDEPVGRPCPRSSRAQRRADPGLLLREHRPHGELRSTGRQPGPGPDPDAGSLSHDPRLEPGSQPDPAGGLGSSAAGHRQHHHFDP